MSTAPAAHKFRVDTATTGDVTVMTMRGIIDETVEGRKLAESVRTTKLVLSLREVRRFASWGMAEWMNFLRGNSERDLYIVECSSYAINQMNLVTGLLGHAKLVSFYLPYRCGDCSAEFDTLILVPVNTAALRELGESEQPCTTCGKRAVVEKFPAAVCETISARPPIDIDDDVLEYLRSTLKYELTADASRFRASRRIAKDTAYLRLSGNIASLPAEPLVAACQPVTVVDLGGIILDQDDPQGLQGWRTFVQSAHAKGTSLQLLDCPTGFLDAAVTAEDLGAKLSVRTFGVLYQCPSCLTPTQVMVDVAENLEQLTQGIAPTAHCPKCKFVQNATLPALVTRLPARERDPVLEKFVAKAKAEPANKLENSLTARAVVAPVAPKTNRSVYLAVGLAMLILAGLVVVAVGLFKNKGTGTTQVATGSGSQTVAGTQPATTPFQRPEWILSDVPASAFCQELINRLVCVGISSFRKSKTEAVSEATDAALEELVSSIGLKVADPFFVDTVRSDYSDARGKALSALQAAELDRTSAAYNTAVEAVRKARKRVVEVLQVSGGAAVPAQRTDWYWEEYAAEKGTGLDVLVFVRFDISLDAVKSLVERYQSTTDILGSSAMTAFPAIAWHDPGFAGGAVLTKVAGPLSSAGATAKQIVTAVGDARITDANGLARKLEETPSGDLKVTVRAPSGPARVIDLHR